MSRKTFSHFKLQGEWAELLFMARAAELGLSLVRPWGDSLPYDVGLVLEQKSPGDRRPRPPRNSRRDGCPHPGPSRRAVRLMGGHPSSRAKLGKASSSKDPNLRPALLRIQIKSTRCRHSDEAYKCHIDSNGTPYTLHELDFIAAYVIPAKVWYIIPLAATRGQTEVLLAPNRPHSKYAQFKEAWHLLRNRDE